MSDCKNTNELVCPYCGHEHDCSYEFLPNDNSNSGSEVKVDCSSCGKEFEFSWETDITYSSYCLDCKHEFQHQPTEMFPDYYECKNCEDVIFKNMVLKEVKDWTERIKEKPESDFAKRMLERAEAKLKLI